MKAEIRIHKSCATIFIDHLASRMNQSNNIVIEEPNCLCVHQGVQYCFAKFEFIGQVCIHDQDCQ